jgi:hypothetical protein
MALSRRRMSHLCLPAVFRPHISRLVDLLSLARTRMRFPWNRGRHFPFDAATKPAVVSSENLCSRILGRGYGAVGREVSTRSAPIPGGFATSTPRDWSSTPTASLPLDKAGQGAAAGLFSAPSRPAMRSRPSPVPLYGQCRRLQASPLGRAVHLRISQSLIHGPSMRSLPASTRSVPPRACRHRLLHTERLTQRNSATIGIPG